MGWLAGYAYKQKVPLKRTGGTVSDYQMKLTVHKGAGSSSGSAVYLKNHALSWTGTVPNDTRFTKADGSSELDYWIESSDANTAIVWIEFDSIGTTDTDFYIYYGKTGDSTTSVGADTFNFFDHFLGDSLDTGKWESLAGCGDPASSIAVADGVVTLLAQTNNGVNDAWLWSKATFSSTLLLRYKLKGVVGGCNDILGDWMVGLTDAVPSQCGDGISPSKGMTYARSSSNDYRHYNLDNSAHTEEGSLDGDYHIIEKVYWSSFLKTYRDGSEKRSDAIDATPDSWHIGIREWRGGIAVDYVFIRNYVSPEPTWGTWGSEEILLQPSAIASVEAFGTARFNFILSISAISSAEALGMPSVVFLIVPSGISSGEAIGNATLIPGVVTITPSGIISSEAFGTSRLILFLSPSGIVTSEAFGDGKLNLTLIASGIASVEAFGTSKLNLWLIAQGIASAEVFGTAKAVYVQTLITSAIASAETFGVANLLYGQALIASAIASLEALGIPQLNFIIFPDGADSKETLGQLFIFTRDYRLVRDFQGRNIQDFSGRTIKDFAGRDIQDFEGREIKDLTGRSIK